MVIMVKYRSRDPLRIKYPIERDNKQPLRG